MNLKIFTTSRQIRRWLSSCEEGFLDKYYTLGEFLNKIVVVKNRIFIDRDLRKKYLFEAVRDVDLEKLGINRDFLKFFKDSDFVFSFFNELFLEQTDIDRVLMNDVYLDYSEHLEILKEIRNNYKKILEKRCYTDRFLIEDFEINRGLLEGIDKIEMVLDGYLSRFDIKVLEKTDLPVEIYFTADRFNAPLLEKSLKIKVSPDKKYRYVLGGKLEEIKSCKNRPDVDIAFFSERVNQINYIFAKIDEFVKSGIEPENIAVVLPDESYAEMIKLFDEKNNLNFAMGEGFENSALFIKLKALYDFKTTNDPLAYKKCEELLEEYESMPLIEFVRSKASDKELKVMDEELFRLEKFENMFEKKEEFLFFVLEKLKNLTFDDAYSGKITCMGVLESRGMVFEGVILTDFNEDIVPNVGESDLFLNTFIRKHSNLPTKKERENLQKHYYYQLINSAKKAAVCYVKNEEKAPSRFLYELGYGLGENGDEVYKEIVWKVSAPEKRPEYNETFQIKEPIAPTTLKTLLECPKKYYFSKILDIQNEEESEEEFFGNIFHLAVKECVDQKAKINNENEYFKMLMENIASKISDKTLLFDVLVKWEDKLKEFCKKDFEWMKYSENQTEEWKDVLFENRRLAMKIDRIDITDNEIRLIDYKTSSSAAANESYIYDFQTTFYFLWAKKNFQKKITTFIWDINNASPVEGVIKTDILKDVLKNLPKSVKEAEDIEIDGKIVKKASDICRYCEYATACGRD